MTNPLINVDDLAGSLVDEDLRIVDTRWYLADPTEGRIEYGRNHIPGAIFLDLDSQLSASEGPGRHPLPSDDHIAQLLGSIGIGNRHRVVVYDDSAGSVAARLWWMLRHLGHDQARVLDGGYHAWLRAGLPTTAQSPAWPAETFVGRPRTDDMITGEGLAARLGTVTLLDARAPERFAGQEDPVDPVAGHIPSAVSAPYAENTAPDGRFRTVPELRRRLQKLGLGGGRAVVTYCGSGVTACSNILAAVAAGLPAPRLYPGSWSDWCTTPGRPIARGPEAGKGGGAMLEAGSGQQEIRSRGWVGELGTMNLLAEAVEEGDPAKLLRLVDGLCKEGDWDGLVELRTRCQHAVDSGKQLWAVADHIGYRLALEAPGEWAGPMVVEGAGRFTLGPLPEVAAAHHTWTELAPHLPTGPARAVAAHERVVRGENLSRASGIGHSIVELPLQLMEWEPAYPVATYHADKAEFPPPELPRTRQVALPETPPPIAEDPVALDALATLVHTWTDQSNGRAEAAAVHGDATGAIRSLGPSRATLAQIAPQLAMALMAWAGASGGAYGRRSGAAAGRYGAWWAAAAVTDLLEDWPVLPEALDRAIGELNWFVWSDLVPPTGWTFHLAVEDPVHELAWAIAAVDAK